MNFGTAEVHLYHHLHEISTLFGMEVKKYTVKLMTSFTIESYLLMLHGSDTFELRDDVKPSNNLY